MLNTLLILGLLAQAGNVPAPSEQAAPAERPSTRAVAAATDDTDLQTELRNVKRIYVDSFGDDKISKQLQAMVINALNDSKRFIVTENKDKADAILKGNALEKTSQELHAIGEGTSVAGASGAEHGSFSGDANGISGSHSGGFVARALGESDSQASTETINDARVAVRLVVSNGDVVWSSTQESTGAKYKGASADVADKVVKQLVRDMDRIAKQPQTSKNEMKLQASVLPSEQGAVQPASVVVQSTPAGADISVDGWFVGNAPSTLKLPPGDHTIAVSASGFKTWQRKMTVTPGSSVTLNATLEKSE